MPKAPSRRHNPSDDSGSTAASQIGVDVAKEELVMSQNGAIQRIPNTAKGVKAWLRTLPAGCSIAMEATGAYHTQLADLAFAAGHVVYVLNPRQIKNYRVAISKHAKTDPSDAALIARFLQAEEQNLFPYRPLGPALRRLHALVRRRGTVTKARTMLSLSLAAQTKNLKLEKEWKALMDQFDTFLEAMDEQIKTQLHDSELKESADRLGSIVGFGPSTTAVLLTALARGDFRSSDALVSYFGLDPRPRDSGKVKGKRRLTKQGDSDARRLLFNAARSASRSSAWAAFYKHHRDHGWAPTQCLCILARKLVRVAWGIHTHQTNFIREKCPQQMANFAS